MTSVPGSSWSRTSPKEAGFNPGAFEDALELASASEIGIGSDLTSMMPDGTRHPSNRPLGPVKSRGSTSGVVVFQGQIVGEYGDIHRPEVTFSCSKSYLSALCGIAVTDGLIDSLDERVGDRIRDGGFDSPQNNQITWRHLFEQTSEWDGELFGIPDWIDRGRQVADAKARLESTVGGSAEEVVDYRPLTQPGTFWEYNDVRVNRASLALLQLFREPLPQVLKRRIMDPIGTSNTWSWHGYQTSWVEIDGRDIESVSGGAHWGGGIWISTLDHARFGLLYQNNGSWGGATLLPESWTRATRTPCQLNPDYGLMFWLNTRHHLSDVAGTDAFAAMGAGGNVVFIWPEAELTIVLRWCASTKGVIDSILKARIGS
ncbi:MAG: serine hydrolase [Gammaproteobacteria bacterium]|nr:serine hydrolase [Gammaproteobacteria bacterium]OUU08405.1 MAG: hypothetical protein CBB94_10620 [Gammaproteobacteria bacterium TMED34]